MSKTGNASQYRELEDSELDSVSSDELNAVTGGVLSACELDPPVQHRAATKSNLLLSNLSYACGSSRPH